MIFKRNRKKENESEYRFVKSVDGKESYTLFNYEEEPIFSATKSKSKQDGYTYVFNDFKKHKKTLHEISRRTLVDGNAGQKLTFDFDGVDIREMLSNLDIEMRVTIITERITDFHIIQGNEDFAFARMERSADRSKKIVISKNSGSEKMLFFVFFAISRLY